MSLGKPWVADMIKAAFEGRAKDRLTTPQQELAIRRLDKEPNIQLVEVLKSKPDLVATISDGAVLVPAEFTKTCKLKFGEAGGKKLFAHRFSLLRLRDYRLVFEDSDAAKFNAGTTLREQLEERDAGGLEIDALPAQYMSKIKLVVESVDLIDIQKKEIGNPRLISQNEDVRRYILRVPVKDYCLSELDDSPQDDDEPQDPEESEPVTQFATQAFQRAGGFDDSFEIPSPDRTDITGLGGSALKPSQHQKPNSTHRSSSPTFNSQAPRSQEVVSGSLDITYEQQSLPVFASQSSRQKATVKSHGSPSPAPSQALPRTIIQSGQRRGTSTISSPFQSQASSPLPPTGSASRKRNREDAFSPAPSAPVKSSQRPSKKTSVNYDTYSDLDWEEDEAVSTVVRRPRPARKSQEEGGSKSKFVSGYDAIPKTQPVPKSHPPRSPPPKKRSPTPKSPEKDDEEEDEEEDPEVPWSPTPPRDEHPPDTPKEVSPPPRERGRSEIEEEAKIFSQLPENDDVDEDLELLSQPPESPKDLESMGILSQEQDQIHSQDVAMGDEEDEKEGEDEEKDEEKEKGSDEDEVHEQDETKSTGPPPTTQSKQPSPQIPYPISQPASSPVLFSNTQSHTTLPDSSDEEDIPCAPLRNSKNPPSTAPGPRPVIQVKETPYRRSSTQGNEPLHPNQPIFAPAEDDAELVPATHEPSTQGPTAQTQEPTTQTASTQGPTQEPSTQGLSTQDGPMQDPPAPELSTQDVSTQDDVIMDETHITATSPSKATQSTQDELPPMKNLRVYAGLRMRSVSGYEDFSEEQLAELDERRKRYYGTPTDEKIQIKEWPEEENEENKEKSGRRKSLKKVSTQDEWWKDEAAPLRQFYNRFSNLKLVKKENAEAKWEDWD